jgi:hypothetical protein
MGFREGGRQREKVRYERGLDSSKVLFSEHVTLTC